MHCVKIQHFPNNELRVTSYPVRGGRFSFEDEDEYSSSVAIAPPPPLSLPTNSELLDKPGFGALPSRTVFGNNARRQILRAGGAIDKSGIPSQEMVFLTGTLPGSTPEAMVAIAAWSGYIVDRLKSWLSKLELDRLEFYCWELQRRGALHLHYCVHIRSDEKRQLLLARFHNYWCKLLENVCIKSGVDVFGRDDGGTWRDCWEVVRADAETVYKSATAYMSKYCSKSGVTDAGVGMCPTRWWGVSRPLSALLKSLTTVKEYICTNANTAKKWWDENCHKLEENCHKLYSYQSKCGLCCVQVGYHSPEDFRSIQSSLIEEKKVKNGWLNKENETEFVGGWMNEPLSEIIAVSTRANEFTESVRKQLVRLIFEGSAAWDADTLVRLYELISNWTFMDTIPSTPYYQKLYPNWNSKAFSNLCWEFCRDLRLAYDRFYYPLTIDSYEERDNHLSLSIAGEIEGVEVFVQKDLFGFRNPLVDDGVEDQFNEMFGSGVDIASESE